MRLARFSRLALGGVITLGGCRDITGAFDFIGGELTRINVGHNAAVFEAGDSVGVDATGSVSGVVGILAYDPLHDAVWAVSDPSVATIRPLPPVPGDSFPRARATVRGLRPGPVTVIASARGLAGRTTLQVVPVVMQLQLLPQRDTIAIIATSIGSATISARFRRHVTAAPIEVIPRQQ